MRLSNRRPEPQTVRRSSVSLFVVFAFPPALVPLPATAAAQYCAYVYSQKGSDSDTVTAIDSRRRAVVASIVTGDGTYYNLGPVAISRDGRFIYSPASDRDEPSGGVSVVDTTTNTRVGNIIRVADSDVGSMAISPDGLFLYVGGDSFSGSATTVSVINTALRRVTVTSEISNANGYGMALSPDATQLYLPSSPAEVVVVSAATRTVMGTIPVTEGPEVVVFDPKGSTAYVAGDYQGFDRLAALTVIDTAAMAATAVVQLPVGNVRDMALSPDGGEAYVVQSEGCGRGPGTLIVIDTGLKSVATTIPVEEGARAIAITPDGSFAWVVDCAAGVSVIDLATNALVATIGVPYGAGREIAFLDRPCAEPPATATPTKLPPPLTPTPGPCYGDCDGNGRVTINDLVRAVSIALGNAALTTCSRADVDADRRVSINELIRAVNAALNGCAA